MDVSLDAACYAAKGFGFRGWGELCEKSMEGFRNFQFFFWPCCSNVCKTPKE